MEVLLNQINDRMLISKNVLKTGTGLLIIKLETNQKLSNNGIKVQNVLHTNFYYILIYFL